MIHELSKDYILLETNQSRGAYHDQEHHKYIDEVDCNLSVTLRVFRLDALLS